MTLAGMIRRVKAFVSPKTDYVVHEGAILPPPRLRKCGLPFHDDEFFLQTARDEARRLADDLRVGNNTSVLDIGCGPGRIPIGILDVIGPVDYTGIDVQMVSIRWCKRYIERKHPSFRFIHINASNERYNERGMEIAEDFRFPFPDKRFDVIILFSVFTHMIEREMRIYLKECKRILKDAGRIYVTAFVEEAVPNISVNPPGYNFDIKGPLHVVRYDKEYLFAVLRECGVSIDEFRHHSHHTQSTLYLSRAT